MKKSKKIIEIKIDNMVFTMPNVVEEKGHDDSFPYYGILKVNGVDLVKCNNNGWGGEPELIPLEGQDKRMEEVNTKLKEYKVIEPTYKMRLKLNLWFMADLIASHQLCQVEFEDEIVKES